MVLGGVSYIRTDFLTIFSNTFVKKFCTGKSALLVKMVRNDGFKGSGRKYDWN